MKEFKWKHGTLSDLPSSLPEGDHFVATRDKFDNPIYPPEVYMGPKDGGSPQLLDKGGATVNAANYVNQTNNGGEAIQAAVNDLPSQGGTVFIPAEGPDDGVQLLDTYDNVWEVTSTITTGESSNKAIRFVGAGRGWETSSQARGTALVASSGIDSIISLDHGFMESIENIGFFSDLTCPYGVQVGNTGNGIDYVIRDCVFYAFKEAQIRAVNEFNLWVDNCWVQITNNSSGAGVGLRLDETSGDAWITNNIFHKAKKNIEVNSSMNRLSVMGNRISSATEEGIKINSDVDSCGIINNSFWDDGEAGDFIQIASGSKLSRTNIAHNKLDAGGNTSYFINNQGTLEDVILRDNVGNNFSSGKYNNVINDVTNTTRVTLNGLGYNGSNDPSASGDWNGNGEEGVRVLWDNSGTPTLAEYVNGSWYSRAL